MTCLEVLEKRKVSCLCWESNRDLKCDAVIALLFKISVFWFCYAVSTGE